VLFSYFYPVLKNPNYPKPKSIFRRGVFSYVTNGAARTNIFYRITEIRVYPINTGTVDRKTSTTVETGKFYDFQKFFEREFTF